MANNVIKMKVSKRAAEVNNWLSPYVGYEVWVIHFNDSINYILDNELYEDGEKYISYFEALS